LVADVGEEGLGDLCGMRAVVDRLRIKIGIHYREGLVWGRCIIGVGYSVDTASGANPGGSFVDGFGKPSAILELARFINV
jgi:hypothetical protein